MRNRRFLWLLLFSTLIFVSAANSGICPICQCICVLDEEDLKEIEEALQDEPDGEVKDKHRKALHKLYALGNQHCKIKAERIRALILKKYPDMEEVD